ncbi:MULTISPECIES: hypothetical protein [unclassified Nocardiopsis]|uniref:hypothetical protein n=1 Tax=unclassified Nocardiopsis TaxID=2649073 RepID=UPI001356C988|nr:MULTISPECIES: hypothetical protein [unclassified Nocardiopsis]
MRKHHKRWVALLGAASIASSGLAGLPGAAADEKDTPAVHWPVTSQSVSSYSLDGYEIGYLPAGLERYGINASSVIDRKGNRQSQLSWIQGSDQLFGRIAVLRSDGLQELDDLRSHRYSHLPEATLQRLVRGEALEHEAYLSQETGDLFWLEEPGVAVAMHLRPDRWGSGELVRMAEAFTAHRPVQGPAEQEPAAQEPASEEGGGAQRPGPGEATMPVDKVADGVPAEVAQDEPPGRPADPAPAEEEAPQTPGATEEPEDAETPGGTEDTQSPEGTGSTEAPGEAGPASPGQPEEAPADGTAGGGDPRIRQAQECLVARFVDFETRQTHLGGAETTPTSEKFLDRVLAQDRLTAAEHDRVLATVWYYGAEHDKTAAVADCARELDMARTGVEAAVSSLAALIAEIVAEANAYAAQNPAGGPRVPETAPSPAEETAEEPAGEADGAQGAEADTENTIEDPVGADEWIELWESLPWSFPAATEEGTS